jgi:hypothetical protein
MGLVEFLARTFIIGGIIALFVFFVAWGIMAVMDRSKSNWPEWHIPFTHRQAVLSFGEKPGTKTGQKPGKPKTGDTKTGDTRKPARKPEPRNSGDVIFIFPLYHKIYAATVCWQRFYPDWPYASI